MMLACSVSRGRLALAAALVLATPAAAALPPGSDDWKYDVIHLNSGSTLKGLIVKEDRNEIVLRWVRRKPGSYTTVIGSRIDRSEIDHIDRLSDADRKQLAERLAALDPTGQQEVRRMASLSLGTADWGKDGKGKALTFTGDHFRLVSNAPEDVVRRIAVRLDQTYAAYARFLPPRPGANGKPTEILVAASLADYQALLKERGQGLTNPAFYDPDRNQVVCGSDLQRLGEELERIRRQHQQHLAELKDKEAELRKVYKGEVPAALLDPIKEARKQIARRDDHNEKVFQEATRRLFQRLYHEAFHAYLANFVYPPAAAGVPRWLNEGLAQIFETAIVEAGELRVGHPDRERLQRVKDLLKKGQLVSVEELLKSGPEQFLVLHAKEQQTSDRHYLTSWALAFYLAFDRRLLGTKALDRYVEALHRGAEPRTAFRELVGQKDLAQFDKEFRLYVQRLR